MKYLKYLIIGIIQGLTEPLPISSSAHIIYINYYLGLEPVNLTTEIIINFSSTLAIFIFFYKDIKELITSAFKENKQNKSYIFLLIIASIPAAIIGLFFKDFIDENYLSFFSSSIMLLFTGLFLLYTYYILKTQKNLNSEINLKSSIVIGAFQGIALIPGLSRSGMTLTAGITTNNSIKTSLRFSFFLYLIASFGALVLEFADLQINPNEYSYLFVSFFSSFITTSLSIRWFFNKINKNSILFFSIYSFLFGSINLLEHFNII